MPLQVDFTGKLYHEINTSSCKIRKYNVREGVRVYENLDRIFQIC